MTGLEVCRRIRELPGGNAPLVIAITGFADDVYQDQANQVGIDLYLLKPMPFPMLERILARFHGVMLVGDEEARRAFQPSSKAVFQLAL